MDRAARIVNRAFLLAEGMMEHGMNTLTIAEEVNAFLFGSGCDKGTVIRISPEEVAWHGMPGSHVLKEGMIATIDIACSIRGWWADSARTLPVGRIDNKRRNLLNAALEATRIAVGHIREGSTGQDTITDLRRFCRSAGVNLVPEGAGHGIGNRLHELPSLTYDGRTHEALEAGRVYTAEPILSAGSGKVALSAGGEASGTDGEPTAHFEVSVLSLADGNQVLGDPEWLYQKPC